MPGPLTRAASGASYSGAFGTDAGDLSKAAAAFMQGRREEEARRHQEALDMALQRLRERQADQGDQRLQLDRDKFGEDRHQFDETMGYNREKMGQDENQFGQRLGFDRDQLGQAASENEKNRKNQLDIARIGAQSRETVASMRTIGSGRDYIVKEDSLGRVWRINKVTGEPTPVKFEQGEQPAGAPGQQMLGGGARPSADEKAANMLATSIEPSVARIDQMYGGDSPVAVEAPSVVEQFMADQSKSHGLGPISSVARSLGNKALGSMNPDYQSILTDMTKVYRAFVYVTTGKQLNESEAQDAAQQYVVLAGDNPALVQKKVQDIKNMTNAIRQSSQRARSFVEQQNASQGTPAPSAPSATPSAKSPADRWEELRAQGLSPEAATAKVKQEMGQ